MNVAYKHLDARLKLADLTIAQWAAVLGGVVCGLVWAQALSPFGPYITLFTAVYIASLPAGAALFAGLTEFDLVLFVRSALAWRRRDGRYVAGSGSLARGYVVLHADTAERARDDGARDLDLAELWAS